jgi:predicted nuclease of restriction endonuclease-like (RecB) superfamily
LKTKTLFGARDYRVFLAALKERILCAQISAVRSVNHELIQLYWDIGRSIVEKQRLAGWGEAVVEILARDLQAEFPDIRGFSARNLWDMRRFFEAYGNTEFLRQAVAELPRPATSTSRRQQRLDKSKSLTGRTNIRLKPVTKFGSNGDKKQFLRQLVAEIPWGHHLLVLNRLSEPSARLYYLRAIAQFGWSRRVLLNQINAGAYERALKEKKTHNFALALPEQLVEQASDLLKSRYNLEFLGIGRALKERELEGRLIACLQRFILELGYGFCFVGRQYRLSLGRKEYFVDLLFYHRFLKALIAFDLKLGPFEPEHAGKMDFYLNLLNEKERAPNDRPSIGIILCAEKDDVEVEFALKTKNNPIGVAEYQLRPRLPAELKGRLPSAKQLADVVRKAKQAATT